MKSRKVVDSLFIVGVSIGAFLIWQTRQPLSGGWEWAFSVAEHSMLALASAGGMSIVFELFRMAWKVDKASSSKEATPREPLTLRILGAFRWFLGRAERDHVDLMITDLKKDIREMRKEGRGRLFINAVVLWQSVRSITGIVWGGVVRVVSKVVPLARFFSRRD